MRELIDLLARDPTQRRNRRLMGAATLLLLPTPALVYAQLGTETQTVCKGGPAAIDPVWGEDRKDEILENLRTGDAEVASSQTWTVIERGMDAYRDAWLASYQSTCEATHVTGEQSGETLDLRMECLRDLKNSMEVRSEFFRDGLTVKGLSRAVDSVFELPPIARCDDVDALRAVMPLPTDPERRERVDALKREAERTMLEYDFGKYEGIEDKLDALTQRAREAEYPPALAKVLLTHGSILADTDGKNPKGAEYLEEAALVAAEAHDNELQARAWTHLAYLVGARRARFDEGLAYLKASEAALRHAGMPPVEHASMLNVRALILQKTLAHEEAIELQKQAIELLTEIGGPNNPRISLSANNLGLIMQERGDSEAAIEWYERAYALDVANYGEDSPSATADLFNMGLATRDQELARTRIKTAARHWEQMHPPAHAYVAQAEGALGQSYRKSGMYLEAREYLTRALGRLSEHSGPQHPHVGICHRELALLAMAQDEHEVALEHLNQEFEIAVHNFGDDHVATAANRALVGSVMVDTGKAAQAIEMLEGAKVLCEQKDCIPHDQRIVLFQLARARHALSPRDDRVRALLRETTALAREAGAVEELEKIQHWLEDNAPDLAIAKD